MYLTHLKAAHVEALDNVFKNVAYPSPDFRGLHVGIEYPVEPQEYPGVWIDWEPTGELSNVGIGHVEHTLLSGEPVLRWRFQGFVTYTAVALSSLERDRMVDELIRVIAFGPLDSATASFRNDINSNDFIAMNMMTEQISQRGFAAAPGTPWGTTEVVYEATLAMECVGEFLSDPRTGQALRISEVITIPYTADQTDPTTTGGWM